MSNDKMADLEAEKSTTDNTPGHMDPLLNLDTGPCEQQEPPQVPARRLSPVLLCPAVNLPLRVATLLLMLVALWAVSFSILQEVVLPGGPVFALAALFLLAHLAGSLVALLRLPPLLGMLLAGVLLRNTGQLHLRAQHVVSTLRLAALVVILIKAGLGLDAAALRRLSFVVVRLALIPCLVEAATVALVARLVLDFPWLWAALLGFVLAAVSPAVVVPSLLALKEQGYGEDKGISTLVIAASSVDDIAAISGFGVVLGALFSSQGDDVLQQALHGPLELLMGLGFGAAWGVLIFYLPHKDDKLVVAARAFLLGAGGLFAVFGSSLVGYPGAGPLATIVAAFVACCGWKKLGWTDNPVAEVYAMAWRLFQPVLFGLIGAEIDLAQVQGSTVTLGVAVLAAGLALRILACLLATLGGTLNAKEMLFVAIAWFPKATVQAALGPVGLDMARKNKADDEAAQLLAAQVLTIAVLSILITAPVGAVGIHLAGPRLLGRVAPEPNNYVL